MKAKLYRIEITECGWLGRSHGLTKIIRELYIPEERISVNFVDGLVNCFVTDENQRYNESVMLVKEVDISEKFVKTLIDYLAIKRKMSEMTEAFFHNEKN